MVPSLWLQLQKVILSVFVKCVTNDSDLRVFECDHGSDGHFGQFAGVQAVRELMLSEYGKNPPHPAVLLVGILPLPIESYHYDAGEAGLLALLQWPGAAYLQYGFTSEELCFIVSRILDGAKEPLPRELLPTPDDVLRLTSEVRHWLANRLNNTNASLSDFRSAADGEIVLHPSHLEPVTAISKQHRKMLNRLWNLDTFVRRRTSAVAGLNAVKDAITLFETRWQLLEETRQKFREEITGAGAGRNLGAVIRKLDAVSAALNVAIKATKRFDHQIQDNIRSNVNGGTHNSSGL